MSIPAPPAFPPAVVVSEGARAYFGYRRQGAATLRLPSSTDRTLAAAVLDDRLGRAAPSALVDRFGRDWAGRHSHG